jgi:hypothetical protein
MVQKFCWKLHGELNLFVLGVDMTKKEEERRKKKRRIWKLVYTQNGVLRGKLLV